jgi:tetratricopeptide (TPR) repeat protein
VRRAAQPLAALVALLMVFSAKVGGMDAREEGRFAHAVTRCTKFAELIACSEALNVKPNNPDLLVAEADALVQLKRPGEAIGVYRNALTVGADRELVGAKIVAAQSLRHSLLESCLTREGQSAERECESAWLPGAPDEVMVFKRRGFLLQGEGRPTAALDAYMAAARLGPKDRIVARAVVNLGESTGRKDAPALTAVGTALLALGRPADAVDALRQALRLAPDLATAKERLRIAERAVAAESRRSMQVADAAHEPVSAAAGAGPAAGVGPAAAGAVAGASGASATFSNAAEETHSN